MRARAVMAGGAAGWQPALPIMHGRRRGSLSPVMASGAACLSQLSLRAPQARSNPQRRRLEIASSPVRAPHEPAPRNDNGRPARAPHAPAPAQKLDLCGAAPGGDRVKRFAPARYGPPLPKAWAGGARSIDRWRGVLPRGWVARRDAAPTHRLQGGLGYPQ